MARPSVRRGGLPWYINAVPGRAVTYDGVHFRAETLASAMAVFDAYVGASPSFDTWTRTVGERFGDTVSLDSDEEFFSEYRRHRSHEMHALFARSTTPAASRSAEHTFRFWADRGDAQVEVTGPTRADVDRVVEVFEREAERARLPPAAPSSRVAARRTPAASSFRVFIGHGHSSAWRELKDHLQEQHHLDVVAFETGARAGNTISDVLQDMLDRAAIAFLVLTAEDETADGNLRARQNVIHEVGLFQGRLGLSRAILVVESGVELFSNSDGIQQLRFEPGGIRSIFGDVLATINRERIGE